MIDIETEDRLEHEEALGREADRMEHVRREARDAALEEAAKKMSDLAKEYEFAQHEAQYRDTSAELRGGKFAAREAERRIRAMKSAQVEP